MDLGLNAASRRPSISKYSVLLCLIHRPLLILLVLPALGLPGGESLIDHRTHSRRPLQWAASIYCLIRLWNSRPQIKMQRRAIRAVPSSGLSFRAPPTPDPAHSTL